MVLCLQVLLGRKMHCQKAKSWRVVVKRRFVGFARNLFISQDVNATRTRSIVIDLCRCWVRIGAIGCACDTVWCVCVSLTSALDFVSDWRNVAIVQCCVCDRTALSAPSCRMRRHRSTTVNRFASQSTGTVLVTFSPFQAVKYPPQKWDLPPPTHTPCAPDGRGGGGSQMRSQFFFWDWIYHNPVFVKVKDVTACTHYNSGHLKSLTSLIPRRFVINGWSHGRRHQCPHVLDLSRYFNLLPAMSGSFLRNTVWVHLNYSFTTADAQDAGPHLIALHSPCTMPASFPANHSC